MKTEILLNGLTINLRPVVWKVQNLLNLLLKPTIFRVNIVHAGLFSHYCILHACFVNVSCDDDNKNVHHFTMDVVLYLNATIQWVINTVYVCRSTIVELVLFYKKLNVFIFNCVVNCDTRCVN